MTYEEAIKVLEYDEICEKFCTKCDNHLCKLGEVIRIGIKCIEMQIPKKPNYLTYDEVVFVDEREDTVLYPHCKECNSPLDKRIDNYCPVCGQHINWSGVEE